MTRNIAIIGGGIVGATAAYYLSRQGHQVTVFDEGTGQATSAAAGIICPWLSKRRNKKWYRLASEGAAFYKRLCEDLATDGGDSSFYKVSGAILLKKTPKATKEQYELGLKRREDAPEMGDLKILSQEELIALLPSIQTQENALFVSGGARLDGGAMVAELLAQVVKNGGTLSKVWIDLNETFLKQYDAVILATGAWLPQILEPLGYRVDIRGQKGQLVVLQTDDVDNGDLPVIMPEGEIDVLPIGNGKVFVGATHENDKGYDITVEPDIVNHLIEQGEALFTRLQGAQTIEVKVGTRAYTSDFSPFFGYVPGQPHLLVASGLGSSGLTTGPLIGYQLARLAAGQEATLPLEDYLPNHYIVLRK
ncbi:NAD(P)/FAD-dependent oxidoreductase [Jeotgalibaca sp. A127]|uniref:NAD(P)/FAD-dependent oxidoreductase n=1 Tax=Jeotgalibaca sp. A127 TaxID=3457324 RepID=UPI003FD61329